MGGDGRGHGEENGDVVGGRLWLRGEIGVREGEGVVKVDKRSVQSSKNWNRLVVRPNEVTTEQGDFQDTKLLESKVEGIH